MQLDEANRELASLKGKRAQGFCPLVNGNCVSDCVCYEQPYLTNMYISRYQIRELTQEKLQSRMKITPEIADAWDVQRGSCCNRMFFDDR